MSDFTPEDIVKYSMKVEDVKDAQDQGVLRNKVMKTRKRERSD